MNDAPYGYWLTSLFTLHGRPNMPLTFFAYSAWTVGGTAASIYVRAPEHEDKPVLVLDSWVLAVIGTALFFLLVFRMQLSYDRWWEGRKIWGTITYTTRDLSRKAANYIRQPELVGRVCRWSIAFAVAIKRHLRAERQLPELADVLSPVEIEAVIRADHMVLFVCEQLGAALEAARASGVISDFICMELDRDIFDLESTLGMAERILTTKMPFAYIVHLRTFLGIWLLALPFVAVVFLGWGGIAASLIVFYGLLSFETISIEIEQPFGHEFNDLPLDRYTTIIKGNIRSIVARSWGVPVESIATLNLGVDAIRQLVIDSNRKTTDNTTKPKPGRGSDSIMPKGLQLSLLRPAA